MDKDAEIINQLREKYFIPIVWKKDQFSDKVLEDMREIAIEHSPKVVEADGRLSKKEVLSTFKLIQGCCDRSMNDKCFHEARDLVFKALY